MGEVSTPSYHMPEGRGTVRAVSSYSVTVLLLSQKQREGIWFSYACELAERE